MEHSSASSEGPREEPTVIWTVPPWRCELWGAAEAGWLVLFKNDEEALRRPTRAQMEMEDVAMEWRQRFTGEMPALGRAEPSRRRLPDRRRVARGGRRAGESMSGHAR
jgi:hypothetical protein